jgi:hypothetical protein
MAYYSLADVLFYGGQAGGGKTDLGIGLAGTRHRKSVFFRREFPQLNDVVSRVEEIYGDRQKTERSSAIRAINWDGVKRLLEFGSVPHRKNLDRWKGRPHGLKFFDEASDFLEPMFRFLCGWTRSTDPAEHVRVIAAGNPPTNPEGEWIIPFFGPWLDPDNTNPAVPGELRWFASLDGKDVEVESSAPFLFKGDLIEPLSRSFIPATLADNPALAANGQYRKVLLNLPEPLRSQLLKGDFSAGRIDDAWQVIPTTWVEMAQERWKKLAADGYRPPVPLTALGVDVARGGQDKTVIAKRYELWFDDLILHPGSDTPDGPKSAGYVVQALMGAGDSKPYINVDVIGYGSSTYDFLAQWKYDAYPVNAAERSEFRDRSEKLRTVNVRAESLWRLREALDPDHGVELCLPPSRTLKADLCAPRWSLTASGILIEHKEEVKKRIGRSPDEGDAVALAFLPPTGRTAELTYEVIQTTAAAILGIHPEGYRRRGGLKGFSMEKECYSCGREYSAEETILVHCPGCKAARRSARG